MSLTSNTTAARLWAKLRRPFSQPRTSIRSRIQWRLMPLVLMIWIAASIAIVINARLELNASFDAQAQLMATALARVDNESIALRSLDWDPDHYRDGYLLRVTDANGTVLFDSHPDIRPFSEEERLEGNAGTDDAGWQISYFWTSGGRQILIARHENSADDLLGAIALAAILPLGFVFAASVIAPLVVVRSGLRPLTRLSRDLRQRAPTQLQPLEDAEAPDELRPIVTSLNNLFQRIEAFLSRERQFVDDAAHELRTPITAIKAQCQAIDATQLDPDSKRRFENILTGVDRAANLANRLLDQARAEQPQLGGVPDFSRCDVDVVLRRTVADLYPMAEARGRHITLSAEHTVPVICRAEDVADILRNLIENAVKYGGSDIRVTLTPEKITVSDNGPGIPVEAQEKVFERFYRGAETTAEEGTGLGLSIAAALARRNGMQLNVTSMEGGTGTQFSLYFPKGPDVAGV